MSLLVKGALLLAAGAMVAATPGERLAPPLTYTNEVDPRVPWSIHVVKVDRARADLRFCTTSGRGSFFGLGLVSEQIRTVPSDFGQPLAGVNGDFYDKAEGYLGRPRDLQIRQGEVLSNPAGHMCFWMDPTGAPRMTNVQSGFRVTWPGGTTTPFVLNDRRTNGTAVLYTAALGTSTHTSGGVEYVLEETRRGDWLPLRIGRTCEARVRAVRPAGDAPLDRETVVLSISPALQARVPALQPGAALSFCLATVPDLTGVDVAIGGGPALVQDGHVMEWTGLVQMRHPRSAVGFNRTHIFLVEVDGRQIDVSVGMTLAEMADYMLKLGCEQAMNFDGGGSSTMWAFGGVRNSPCEGQERPAANALVVVKSRPLSAQARPAEH